MTHRQHVRNLILIISSACGLGILMVVAMVYWYGPTGSYKLSNVLLSPSTTEGLRYQHDHMRYVFHQVQFLYRNPDSKNWEKLTLTPETYGHIYALIQKDISFAGVPPKVEQIFSHSHPAALVLSVRPEFSNSQGMQYHTFQEVNVLDDHYRVELHVEGADSSWAYFEHPGILSQIIRTVGEQP